MKPYMPINIPTFLLRIWINASKETKFLYILALLSIISIGIYNFGYMIGELSARLEMAFS